MSRVPERGFDMIIQCTKKVLDRIKMQDVKDSPLKNGADDGSRLYAWHTNIITVNRRKLLIFVNDFTELCVIWYRPEPCVYKDLEGALRTGISELLKSLGFRKDVIEAYLKDSGTGMVTKSGSKSAIARMNHFMDHVKWVANRFGDEKGLMLGAMMSISRFPVSEGGGYFIPEKRMTDALTKYYCNGASVREYKSYVLRIQLNLSNFDIYRRIEMPVDMAFYDLHQAIITTFGWFDYHNHCFELMDNSLDEFSEFTGRNVEMYIYDGMDQYALEYLNPEDYTIKSDMDVMLSEVFEKYDWCLYTYDFGDGWEHIITVEERRSSDERVRSRMIERHGERPPEDVGGEGGFEDYMMAIADPENPEHDSYLVWSETTKAKQITDEEINRRLSWLQW